MRRDPSTLSAENAKLKAQLAALEAERRSLEAQHALLVDELVQAHERIARIERDREELRRSYERLKAELARDQHRIQVAKAERVDTTQLELEFAKKLEELEKVAETLGLGASKEKAAQPSKERPKPTGRRDLRELPLREERIEVRDARLDKLVEQGLATVHGYEESCRLARIPAETIRVVVARVKYRFFDDALGETTVVTAAKPDDLLDRSLATASLAAYVIRSKIRQGLTLFRLEEQFTNEGVPWDRGTMSRLLEELGATFGKTVIEAMGNDAKQNAFCIATDATGFKVQPPKAGEKKRKPCLRGHIRTMIADRDHVIFDYVDSENSAAIQELFAGYQGYVQADAASVYDALIPSDRASDPPCLEVACWSHLRRYFWKATVGERSEVAKEALYRVHRIFDLDAGWQNRSARARQLERDKHLRPHVEAFFDWCRTTREQAPPRSLLAKAFGYSLNHEPAFRRFQARRSPRASSHARCVREAPRPSRRDVLPRRHPRAALLARRPLPRALPARVGEDARETRRRGAGGRGRDDHGAADRGLTGDARVRQAGATSTPVRAAHTAFRPVRCRDL